MKKIFFLLLGFVFFAGPVLGADLESIKNYNAEMYVEKSGTMFVNEQILYDFGNNNKHGIFRTLPLRFVDEVENKELKYNIEVLKITDENNVSYKYKLSDESGMKVIKIGDPNGTITGVHWYQISYAISPAIIGYTDHDEFYWDVIGLDWPVAINQAQIIIKSKGFEGINEWQTECYTGVYDSLEQNCTLEKSPGQIIINTTQGLNVNEGVTLGVIIPKGIFSSASLTEIKPLIPRWLFILPFLLFILGVWLWWPLVKQPKNNQPIITQFEPLLELNPLESGILVYARTKRSFFTATIVDLAVRGYLKIKNIPSEIKLGFFKLKPDDFELSKLKITDSLKDSESKLFEALFESGEVAKMSKLKYQLASAANTSYEWGVKSLEEKKYFIPRSTGKVFVSGAVLVLLFMSFCIPIIAANHWLIIVLNFILSLISFVMFFKLLAVKQLTEFGLEKKNYLLGLKEYIKVAEKYRLEFHNAPEKNAAHFEKLLPYAIVFGLVENWTGFFKDVLKENPAWYSGTGAFSAVVFTSSLNSFSSSVQSVVTSQSSSGGSFGGGGSSGGGGGGGGGGSW